MVKMPSRTKHFFLLQEFLFSLSKKPDKPQVSLTNDEHVRMSLGLANRRVLSSEFFVFFRFNSGRAAGASDFSSIWVPEGAVVVGAVEEGVVDEADEGGGEDD
jgi:hypothetical protein